MEDLNPPADDFARPLDVARALQRVLLYGILPLWTIPGFVDYLLHRKSDIEHTSGTHESMLHALQMTTIGIPTLMALLLEVNAGTVAAMIGGVALHEALTLWDIAYAEPLRRPSPSEQHAHSFLEVVPLMALTSMLSLHPAQTAALFGRGTTRRAWALKLKAPPLSRRYIAGIFALIGSLLFAPYTEELVRCWRVDRTFAPHSPPADA